MTEADEELVERIRPFMKRRKGYSEKKMFGGLCFFINGNMTVGPWKGSLIVRMAKEDHDETQTLPHATPMDITGKASRVGIAHQFYVMIHAGGQCPPYFDFAVPPPDFLSE